jgi:hypothetical protein
MVISALADPLAVESLTWASPSHRSTTLLVRWMSWMRA